MTYSELVDHLAAAGSVTEKCTRLRGLDSDTLRAWYILDSFDDREGFSGWWEGLDRGVRDDVFRDIREILEG